MGGELYALSWSLVEFAATSEVVRTMTIGFEDQQVSCITGVKSHNLQFDVF
jgi:hypothetical protein